MRDSVIHFHHANVFHMGDVFFNGSYPFIDLSSGGSFAGVLAAAEGVLEKSDENSKIIPGHGPRWRPGRNWQPTGTC